MKQRRVLESCLVLLALIMVAVWGSDRASAQTAPCTFPETRPRFPRIPAWALSGAYQDSSLVASRRCVGSFQGPLPDSLATRGRTISLRFLRDRVAEARPDFGGYRIYRVVNQPDTSRMMLIRRFSLQPGDRPPPEGNDRLWKFSIVDTSNRTSLPFRCGGAIVHDSIVTFIDPDSNGHYIKACRRRIPQDNPFGACASRGDSVFVLVPPPGPHDGFRTWYAITYEARNVTVDAEYADMFVPDTTGIIGPCTDPNDLKTCPNLNNKCYNLIEAEVEPTSGPLANLERVGVVPNPYRAREAWDQPGLNEVHFVNLPARAVIKIYTVSGDLVTELTHDDRVRDFERWNLKNQNGEDVSSGIYMFRVESDIFRFQDRFIIIR
jgi:hypothetical protein